MSNLPGSSFLLRTPDSVALKQSKNANQSQPHPFIVPSAAISSPTASAGPSTLKAGTAGIAPNVDASKSRHWSPEELEIARVAKERFVSRLAADQAAVLQPDVDTPFVDVNDAINRLLPYHIFHQPKDDLEWVIHGHGDKGKQKASPEQIELSETKFALECHRRRQALRDKFRRIRIREGKRSGPGDQAYSLAQAVLDSERTETAWMNAELRNARAELDKIEREKRAANPPTARTSYYTSPAVASSTLQAQWYRPYPYAYSQPYAGVPTPMNLTYTTPVTSASYTNSTTSTVTTTTTTSPSVTTQPTHGNSIPVQLPVSSLPALHSLGITPVPAASLTAGQPPPPAVLRGSSANGTMLSLEINVSLLKSAQMSGLAIILNSLMSRGAASSSAPSSTPNTSTLPLSTPSGNGSSS